jgi:hypothetical protein
MNVYRELYTLGEDQREGRFRGVCYIYTYEDSVMKPTTHCLKKGREGLRGNENLMEV